MGKKYSVKNHLMGLLIFLFIVLAIGCTDNSRPTYEESDSKEIVNEEINQDENTDIDLVVDEENKTDKEDGEEGINEVNSEADIENEDEIRLRQSSKIALGGIHLGDSMSRVVEILGLGFDETIIHDDADYIGEDLIEWTYKEGITVSFGVKSKSVLKIVLSSSAFETEMGAKVGDNATEVFGIYDDLYDKMISRHSDDILIGWYIPEEYIVLIFDTDKNNYTRVNGKISMDSNVEEIVLQYNWFD
ncbi:hypothetical protein [Alkaliphilus peptidifermentans]|uniref:Lipoprotein n=1 Tax=Alkaliphilus peptidifermentans DSM 18978 TaxID=1120976 RepID=A0A1G5ICW1_9FIRM|nr:hypothetical protein [Alkaliphilus peptidifermentans]SCY73843.1 hypothetical protein SAMN03080606_02346 [Alkaliphilus peptidifermentans DSM 18978]